MIHDEHLHKFLNDELTQEELEEFKLREEYEDLAVIKEGTSRLLAPQFDRESMLQQILDGEKTAVDTKKTKVISFIDMKFVIPAIAASLLLVASVFLFQNNADRTIFNNTGQQLTGNFPDQSKYKLDSDSKIVFDQSSWDKRRLLDLEGKAEFDVKKGKPFLVKTQLGSVEVLGTRFIVKGTSESFEVRCNHGKVAVKSMKIKIDEILMEGDYVNADHTGRSIASIQGVIKMKSVSILEVIKQLESSFDVVFELDLNNLDKKVNANYDSKDLGKALESSLSAFGIKYSIISEDKVILRNQ